MSGILIYADKANLAREMRTAADEIAAGAPIKLIACSCDEGVAESGAADTYKVDVPAGDINAIAAAVAGAAKALDCDLVILASDRRGKDLSGRLAQKLGAGVITGVSAVANEGGKIVASYGSLGGAVVNRSAVATDAKVIAISPNNYAEAAAGSYAVEDLAVELPAAKVTCEGSRPKEGSSVDVAAAEILVVVGLGVEDQGKLPEIEDFAASIGGVVGCTKPVATDRKWFSEDRIVGISGKSCKPRLAILLGVSGQVQFWAGIRDAELIVAINTDENAGAVKQSDMSFVSDAIEGIAAFKAAV